MRPTSNEDAAAVQADLIAAVNADG